MQTLFQQIVAAIFHEGGRFVGTGRRGSPYLQSIANPVSKYWRGWVQTTIMPSGMKSFTRTASVVWEGSHQHGEGAITTQSAILKKARYVSGNHLGRAKGTNPPELIAAAHASSFSMALADELGHAGYCPEQIDTTATVTMEHVAAGWTMTGIHLDVIAWVPHAAQCDFIDAAVRAKTSCFISRLLHAKVSMFAKLTVASAAG